MKGSVLFLISCCWTTACAFAPVGWERSSRLCSRYGKCLESTSSSSSSSFTGEPSRVDKLKSELLEKIATLNRLQEEDGKIAVDFGVKGGEIDQKSRAPRKLDFYTVSERVGKAADAIFETVEELSEVNPTTAATEGLGDKNYAGNPPLDGPWNLLFSTAADANFSKDSKRGDATAGNIVEARRGKMTNVIKFAPSTDKDGNPKPKAVDELRVRLAATAEGPNRVSIVFRYVAVKFTKFFFLPLRWTLYIPVPAPVIGKIVIAASNLKNRLLRNKTEPRKPPKGFFDVLFLDRELRVHKTGESNFFVQARPDWTTAWETVGS